MLREYKEHRSETCPYDCDLSTYTRRIDVDIAKGVGIILVVVGHLAPMINVQAIYLFHMPLFFVLGGITLRPVSGATWPGTKRLLVPYASFVFIFSVVPTVAAYATQHYDLYLMAKELAKAAAGGELLVNTLGTVWFITCYVASRTIVISVLNRWKSEWLCCILLLIISIFALVVADMFPKFFLPWALNVAPVGALLIYVGYRIRASLDDLHPAIVAIILAVGATALIAAHLHWIGTIEMKYADFGTPGISLIAGCIASIAVILMSRALATFRAFRPLAKLGRASGTIMYFHLPVGYLLSAIGGITSSYIVVVFALLSSFVAHFILNANWLTRKLFLGQ